jgi:glycosyltransferase involved in cell wall biosynthesis
MRPVDPVADATLRHARLTMMPVPYYTFPYAGRRGTTILDRSTAYPWFGWRAGRIAARLAETGLVDIVHGLGASALGYAVRQSGAQQRRGAPFVFNPQGMEEFGATDPGRARLKRIGYWPLRQAVRACARVADCVIATDRALVQPVLTHLPVAPSVVRVIPNAIDLADIDRIEAPARGAALRAQAGLGPDDVLLLSVGRLEANKGFTHLVKSLSALVADGTLAGDRWRWVLVGQGPMGRSLERDIRAHDLQNHVVLWGRAELSDLHAWYETATLFVHPTLYEGSSLVTLEAMAHRRAVVATVAGGLPDKVRPGINGWLVSPGDAQALADAIRTALSNRERLIAMGLEGRAIVEREFSWDAVADRLVALYEELLSPRGPYAWTPAPMGQLTPVPPRPQ